MIVLVIGIVVSLLAFAWKARQVWRAPHDLALRVVAIALFALAMTLVFVLNAAVLDDELFRGATALLTNLFGLGFALLLLWFFYLADRTTQQRGNQRAKLQLVPMLAAATAMTVVFFQLSPAARDQGYIEANMQLWPLAVFYGLGNLYLLYATTLAARLAVRYAATTDPRTARGLRVAAVGLVLCAVSALARIGAILIRFTGQPVVFETAAAYTLFTGLLLFLAGVTYPGARARTAAVRRWFWHRRVYPQLALLWTLLVEAFPETTLERAPRRGVRPPVRGVHRNCYRRWVECRDGLVRVSPYLANLGVRDGVDDPVTVAAALRPALADLAADRPLTDTRPPITVLPLAEDDLDSDIRTLVALSAALAEQNPEHARRKAGSAASQ